MTAVKFFVPGIPARECARRLLAMAEEAEQR